MVPPESPGGKAWRDTRTQHRRDMGAAAQQQPPAPMELNVGDLHGSRRCGTALPAPGVTPAPVGVTHRWFHPDPPRQGAGDS